MDVDELAAAVYERLGIVDIGTVVAIWANGEITAHRHLGFRFRVLPDGKRESPVTSFVAAGIRPYIQDIAARIKAAFDRIERENERADRDG
jgi:hypothetical protein